MPSDKIRLMLTCLIRGVRVHDVSRCRKGAEPASSRQKRTYKIKKMEINISQILLLIEAEGKLRGGEVAK